MGSGWLLVVAAGGYGKTTALRAAAGDTADGGSPAYFDATELTGRLAAGGVDLPAGPGGVDLPAGPVVVDDVGRLPAAGQRDLVRWLGPRAGAAPVSLGSRRPLSRTARAALPGLVTERGPTDLALGPDAVARVLRDGHGVEDPEHALAVHDVTGGWPALVHLAGTVLAGRAADRDDLLGALTEAGAEAGNWVREQVLGDLPAGAARFLDAVVDLELLAAPLCAHLAGAGALPAGSPVAFDWLVRTGLVVPHRQVPNARARGAYRLVPVVAAVAARSRRRPGATARGGRGSGLAQVAAGWYLDHGFPLAAAAALHRAGDTAGCHALVEERAEEMLAAGGAADVVRLLQAGPPADLSCRLQLVLGDALRMSGDVPGALRVFAPLLDRAGLAGLAGRASRPDPRLAGPAGRLDPGLAWRAGMVHYLSADYPAALDVYDRATADSTVDTVLLHAGRAATLSMLGSADAAAASAARALDLARQTGCARALAAAHIAVGVTAVGAQQDDHLAAALVAAERAGDVVQAARALVNQTDGLLREARYPQALAVAARAVRYAELGGPPGVLVIALHNAGEALSRLGRYDEAAWHFERSVRVCRRTGLRRTALGLCGLAELHRQRGRREQSRTAFAEAVDRARATAETQVLVPALAGLARLLLDPPGADPAAARTLAAEAERLAPPALLATAVVAAGWVELHGGDLAAAGRRAVCAVTAARAGRAADALADALELAAAVAADPAEARAALTEALTIWQRSGALPAADRVLVLLGRVPGADGAQRAAARAAAKQLAGLGVRILDGSPLLPADGATAPVRVRVLGGFEVYVGGQLVPLPAWRSRQARTLVKVLVARRGRPVPRGELCELLWPDDQPQRTGHRLSVLLSVVRGVLDPQRVWPADHYLRADLAGISLDLGHLSVDVEILLRDAAHAADLLRRGRPDRAREILVELDDMYAGDAFDEEPYEDWADGLREQARAGWLRALRDLAEIARRAGDPEQAIGCLVRLLAADPFDEPAHRTLVRVLLAAGRHGAARRAFDRWTEAMRTVDAPAPDPAVLRGGRTGPADAPLTPR